MAHLPSSELNLTRLWRSRRFEEIIGQELILKIIKNSLYKEVFFPVYLFAGSRGCGKTTTARVFSAAVNCEQLATFQKNPETALPCLVCTSCSAFFAGEHPDFIEFDAASHTSVDHVRTIIESASFLPVLGRKKIYLIDEAHMLSKAAWNAFLKMLEEPPRSVIFILATTDAHKIIDTVISRCFQLYFEPISCQTIEKHLALICTHESIEFEPEALKLIASASQGSARDALNLLERVRYAAPLISKQATIEALGCIDNGTITELFTAIFATDSAALVRMLADSRLEKTAPLGVWKKCLEFLNQALWLLIGKEEKVDFCDPLVFKELLKNCSLEEINQYRKIFYDYEQLFAKTAAPQMLLETLLLLLCSKKKESSLPPVSTPAPVKIVSPLPASKVVSETKTVPDLPEKSPLDTNWQAFIADLSTVCDPIIQSVFKQGLVKEYKEEEQSIRVAFPRTMALFQAQLTQAQPLWQPLLEKIYGTPLSFTPEFSREQATQTIPVQKQPLPAAVLAPKERKTVPDTQLSARAQEVISLFPGTVTIMKEELL
jgi:DNA polymerase III subunit gamma/tau